MFQQLLQDYLDHERPEDPCFQPGFKVWVRHTYAGRLPAIEHWVAKVGPDWPSETEVAALCKLVSQQFQPEHWPRAFLHLLLTVTPGYDLDGQPWDRCDDPLQLLPENIGRFFRAVRAWVDTCITTYSIAGNDAARQQLHATRAALEAGPPVQGVLRVRGAEQMYQARAVAVPYAPCAGQAMPPVQSLDFQPDGGCTDAMQTAAGACVKKLRDAEWGALLKTALGGPFGWSSVLVVCGVFFYCSVALQPVSHDFALTWWMM